VKSDRQFLFSLVVGALLGSVGAYGQQPETLPMRIGDTEAVAIHSPHPYTPLGPARQVVWTHTLHRAGATFVRLHFAPDSSLGHDGDELVIRDGRGRVAQTFRGDAVADRWTRSIEGDTVTVELVADGDGGGHGVGIDQAAWGTVPLFPSQQTAGSGSFFSICNTTVPSRIRTSDAVARLNFIGDCGGSFTCSAWLFSPLGHLMTNAHCANSVTEGNSAEVWFNFMGFACDLPAEPNPDAYQGTLASFQHMNCDLDYAVHMIDDPVKGNPAAVYGYLDVNRSMPANDTEIWIPQHPGGQRRQIAEGCAINDSEVGGFNGCADPPDGCDNEGSPQGMTDLSFNCVIAGGSSGSPVLNANDQVIAIAHAGSDIENFGVRMNAIAADIPNPAILLSVTGPAMVNEGETADFTAVVSYLFSADRNVTTNARTIWSVMPPSAGTISMGHFTAAFLNGPLTATVRAAYTQNGVTVEDSVLIQILDLGNTPSIVSSQPPNNAIDAGQPSDPGRGDVPGWTTVDITFVGGIAGLDPGDFEIIQQGGVDLPPSIVRVETTVNPSTARLVLSGRIAPGAWTTFRHTASGTSTRLGFLPADVNADGTSAALDILALIDSLNRVGAPRPLWSTDVDRSGEANSADILREIDLLNGAGVFDAWNGVSLP